jgi:large subunit ribosomal protein L19
MISATVKDVAVKVGDTVRVKTTVVEGNKTRVQTFEGIVISLRGRGENKTFTVRRIGNRQIGIERTWPLDSTAIVGLEVAKNAKKVRRSKLYFLRDLTGKAASQV